MAWPWQKRISVADARSTIDELYSLLSEQRKSKSDNDTNLERFRPILARITERIEKDAGFFTELGEEHRNKYSYILHFFLKK